MVAVIIMACEVKWNPLFWDYEAGPEMKARCQKAYKLYQQYQTRGEKIVIIVSAGRRPGAASTATAHLMASCLTKEGIPWESIIVGLVPLYTTASELKINLKLAKEKGAEKIQVVSSWYHLPRLWLLMQTEKSPRLACRFIPVFKRTRLWRFFREILRLCVSGMLVLFNS